MKVYLLNINAARQVFYSEEPEVSPASEVVPPRQGMRGWVERKYKGLQVSLTESEHGMGRRVAAVWQWLHRWTSPDEALLRRLRGASEIEVFYPTTLSRDAVSKRWSSYLAERRRHHLVWLVANAIIAPLTIALSLVPGPNVIGYWFTYRAVCHFLAIRGVWQAQSASCQTTWHPSGALDELMSSADSETVLRVATLLGLRDLPAYVNQTNTRKESRQEAPLVAR